MSVFKPDLLAGRVALVTGGGTGIGKEIARVLAEHGARVAIMGRRQHILEATVEELESEGFRALATAGDIRDPEAVQASIDHILGDLGGLDIVVNNAAGNFPAPLSRISPAGPIEMNEAVFG